MYMDKLQVTRAGDNYLVITGYMGEVKKTFPMEERTARKLLEQLSASIENKEWNRDGVTTPRRGIKPSGNLSPLAQFFHGTDDDGKLQTVTIVPPTREIIVGGMVITTNAPA